MIRWLFILLCIPARGLVLTNGPDADISEPQDQRIGWRLVAQNGPATACGPRLACSVQHVGIFEPIFQGLPFHVLQVIEPVGSDVRFMVLDRDLPGYAPIYANTNWPSLNRIWLVAGGVGTGSVVGGTNFAWGAEGQWPVGTRRLRWGWSDHAEFVPEFHTFLWRFDQAASASGDSGYAAFTEDGQYIGPIAFGANPCELGSSYSGGRAAGAYLDLIKDYIGPSKNAPPKPRVISNLTVKASP